MAEEKIQSNSGLTTTLPLIALLAILASWLFPNPSPYQEERPSSLPLLARSAGAQDVDARLWQDPFTAVEGAIEETPPEKIFIVAKRNGETLRLEGAIQTANSSSHTPSQIYKGDKVADGEKITILAVTLPGGPYQEAAEQRMRWRYAVLSALANQDAFPQDEQHIGYFEPKSEIYLQKRVPFEWWSGPDDKEKVLLLWVDESSMLEQPAKKLKDLLSEAGQGSVPNQIQYRVIGPNSSTILRDLLKEVKGKMNDTSSPVAKCSDTFF